MAETPLAALAGPAARVVRTMAERKPFLLRLDPETLRPSVGRG
jgi:hypothetical protein